jgi:hypothetical protein
MTQSNTFVLARAAAVNPDGTLTWAGLQTFLVWNTQLQNGLSTEGNLISSLAQQVAIIGKQGTIGTITQNIDANGVITADGIDFSRIYKNQNIDYIADGTGSPLAGGKIAFLALSNPLTGNVLEWDGASWQWVARAQTQAPTSHEWLASYDQATGNFTQSQPAFSDISGTAAKSQIGTGTPLAGEYVDGGTGAWTPLPGGSGPNFADNEILAGSGTAWTFANAPISALPASTSVHLYAQEYNGGPFVRLPPSAITSITGTAMVTAASWTAGALMADYRY